MERAGAGGNKKLNQFLFLYGPALGTYFGIFQSLRQNRAVDEMHNNLDKAKKHY